MSEHDQERERDAHSGTATTGHEWDGIKELDTPLPRWWCPRLACSPSPIRPRCLQPRPWLPTPFCGPRA